MKCKLLGMIVVIFSILVCQAVYADDSRDSVCPKHAQQRTVVQVLQAHLAAVEAGNAELLACDYAKDAVFILPGAVAQGPAEIEAAFAPFFALAGGNIHVTTTSLTIAGDFTLFEYSVTSDHVVVTDGVDSFVIDKGLIIAHTAHLGGFSVK
ncbi:MAG: nuclear transport factor 2 family protein [Betaproteobacteria bacterium]|nr:MAG: nuclear transport factor 2 family protein [Betaproteobacteria bacterium]